MCTAAQSEMLTEIAVVHNDCCAATLPVSACSLLVSDGAWGENGGCIFKVGDDMYFVPTQQVAEDDTLYITCDAQKIEGPLDSWRSRLALGDIAASEVEDAILRYLHAAARVAKAQGDVFVVTSDGKTFRL
jgi:hypothetical protein